jgi:bacillithiol system protein YtxJ
MNWHKIASEQALDKIAVESLSKPVLLFKHSHRCSVSAVALSRLERAWKLEEEQISPYILDVVWERPISNKIAEKFEVQHESPQVLLIKEGKCVYTASHLGIDYKELASLIHS